MSGDFLFRSYLSPQKYISCLSKIHLILILQKIFFLCSKHSAINRSSIPGIQICQRYRDEMADREEELRIGFADGRWAVAEGTADVTVICRQGDLAALLMGSCGLTALLRLGAASADDAEKARQLAQLLYCVQKPWLNADY